MRLSIGLEDFEDLKNDLIHGLRKVVQVSLLRPAVSGVFADPSTRWRRARLACSRSYIEVDKSKIHRQLGLSPFPSAPSAAAWCKPARGALDVISTGSAMNDEKNP